MKRCRSLREPAVGEEAKEDDRSVETSEISAEEVRTFQHFSVHNAAQTQKACPEGTCQAYRDIFTYRR